jgi:hypothetical protein
MRWFVALVLASGVACGPAADTGEPPEPAALPGFGVVLPDCAPWDGPAYELRLLLDEEACDATSSGATVVIDVYTTDIAAGDTFDLKDFDVGFIRYIGPGGEEPAAMSATLTIDAWRDGDDYARGRVDASFDEGTVVRGSFAALASCIEGADPALCG